LSIFRIRKLNACFKSSLSLKQTFIRKNSKTLFYREILGRYGPDPSSSASATQIPLSTYQNSVSLNPFKIEISIASSFLKQVNSCRGQSGAAGPSPQRRSHFPRELL